MNEAKMLTVEQAVALPEGSPAVPGVEAEIAGVWQYESAENSKYNKSSQFLLIADATGRIGVRLNGHNMLGEDLKGSRIRLESYKHKDRGWLGVVRKAGKDGRPVLGVSEGASVSVLNGMSERGESEPASAGSPPADWERIPIDFLARAFITGFITLRADPLFTAVPLEQAVSAAQTLFNRWSADTRNVRAFLPKQEPAQTDEPEDPDVANLPF